ncbi:hypothetical protein [Endothiovibrio diazotrophicus]
MKSPSRSWRTATPTETWTSSADDDGGTWGSNAVTVARNGTPIMGLAEDLVRNIANQTVERCYVDISQDWRIV